MLRNVKRLATLRGPKLKRDAIKIAKKPKKSKDKGKDKSGQEL